MFLMIFLCFIQFCLFFLFFFLAFACLFLKRKRKGKAWSYMGGKVGRIWEEINEVKLIRIYNMEKILAIENQIYLLMPHSFNMMLKILSII